MTRRFFLWLGKAALAGLLAFALLLSLIHNNLCARLEPAA